jgi:hypothetical protein
VFDQVLPTVYSAITAVIMQPNVIPHAHVGVNMHTQEDVPIPQISVEAPSNRVEAPPYKAVVPVPPVVNLHHMFGHLHFNVTKRSAKYYNIKLCGEEHQ